MAKKTPEELHAIQVNINQLSELGVPQDVIDRLQEWLEEEKRR